MGAVPVPASVGQAEPRPHEATLGAWYALGVLTLVTLFAMVDRGVLVLQAEVIRQSLNLSDLQLGLTQGTGVAIFAGLAAYPLAWLADRYDRRLVLGGCVMFWSVAVVASGLAQTWEQLLIASALVGAGEAGLVPIVFAMIPDLFPERRRQLANSIYSVGSQATNAAGLAIIGALVGAIGAVRPLLPVSLHALEDWRLAFLCAAAPAPLMLLALATVRFRARAPRGARAADAADAASIAPAPPLWAFLSAHRQTFVCFYGGVGLTIFGFNCVGSWIAVIYMRVFGQTAAQLGAVLGSVALASTVLGFVLSVYGVRFLQARIGPRMNIRVLWFAAVSAAVTFSMMVFARNAQQMYAIQGLYILLVTTAVMVYPTALQSLVPAPMRARATAVVSVLSAGLGALAAPTVGVVSDQLKHLPNGLILSAVSVAVPALLVAVALFVRCERLYLATAAAARAHDEAAGA